MKKSAGEFCRVIVTGLSLSSAVLVLSFSACDDADNPSVDGGSAGGSIGGMGGGAGGTGGAGGAVAKDGGADSGPGAGCFPECVRTLFEKCWPAGPTCSSSRRGPARLECFSNGVKMDVDTEVGGLVTLPNSTNVCYSIQISSMQGTGAVQWKYFRANDVANPVATATFPSSASRVGTIRCEPLDGKPGTDAVPIDLGSPACDDSRNGFGGERVVMCTQDGTCTVPISAQLKDIGDRFQLRSSSTKNATAAD